MGLASDEIHEFLIALDEVKVHQRFLDEMDRPLTGVQCTLYEEGDDEPLAMATTDESGEVCFEKLNKKIFNLEMKIENGSEALFKSVPYLRSNVAEPHIQHLRLPILEKKWEADPSQGTEKELIGLNPKVLKKGQLDKATEKKDYKDNKGHGLLRPYLTYDPENKNEKKVVICVHGVGGGWGELTDIVEHFAARKDVQVYIFQYNSVWTYVDRSSEDLARSIETLRKNHLKNKKPHIRIVAHSLGGIIARGALNFLVDPTWFCQSGAVRLREVNSLLKPSVAKEYEEIQVVAIDSPWHGTASPWLMFKTHPRSLAYVLETCFVDMTQNSRLLDHLHQVKLPEHFKLDILEANNRDKFFKANGYEYDARDISKEPDSIAMGFNERPDKEIDELIHLYRRVFNEVNEVNEQDQVLSREIVNEVLGGFWKWSLSLRNSVMAMMSDKDYTTMDGNLRDDFEMDKLKVDAEGRALMRRRIREVIPAYAGQHDTIIKNPLLHKWLDHELKLTLLEKSEAVDSSKPPFSEEETITKIKKQMSLFSRAINAAVKDAKSLQSGQMLNSDDSTCNTAAGLVKGALDQQGYTTKLIASNTHIHVRVKTTGRDVLIDPTMAQFYKDGTGPDRLMKNKDGFVGTEEDLKEFLGNTHEEWNGYQKSWAYFKKGAIKEGKRLNWYANIDEFHRNSKVPTQKEFDEIYNDKIQGWRQEFVESAMRDFQQNTKPGSGAPQLTESAQGRADRYDNYCRTGAIDESKDEQEAFEILASGH